ncbi:hypothetical protein GBAR_LOCUS21904 [Geodia barretti]|uniref:Uncharacterized protein n=1 Tax=Geodia barretti TaxID=519541 RepID=A0AA35T1A6_GEOBA|nr:hypothetical protein GBAR_LOCUS21904 [Geodia barretti]
MAQRDWSGNISLQLPSPPTYTTFHAVMLPLRLHLSPPLPHISHLHTSPHLPTLPLPSYHLDVSHSLMCSQGWWPTSMAMREMRG